MESKKQLLKESAKWTVKEVETHKRLAELLPHISNLSQGEPLIPWMPTQEKLDEITKFEKEEDNARDKRREIMRKLTEL